jgi:hypothetical protein
MLTRDQQSVGPQLIYLLQRLADQGLELTEDSVGRGVEGRLNSRYDPSSYASHILWIIHCPQYRDYAYRPCKSNDGPTLPGLVVFNDWSRPAALIRHFALFFSSRLDSVSDRAATASSPGLRAAQI